MKVLIFGLGVIGGGHAAALYFLNRGDEVRITDLKGTEELRSSIQELKDRGAQLIIGEHRAEEFLWADIVVKNPAIPPNHPMLKKARMVINDFAWLFSSPWCEEVKIIAITGTKGKTTTSAAVAHTLEQLGHEAMQCGNMGISAFSVLAEWEKRKAEGKPLPEYLVCEFSSWQVRDTVNALHDTLPPLEVCALTNFYPDHLNTYDSIERYLEDKLELFTPTIKHAVVPDALMGHIHELTGLDKRKIRGIDRVSAKELDEHQELKSAYAILLSLGFKYKSIIKAFSTFQGVPHRIEQVATQDGILFINDSAATIPEAVHFTFSRFDELVVHLICGGTDKMLEADAMIEDLERAQSISLLDGSFTRQKLIPRLKERNIAYLGPFSTMQEAFTASYESALKKREELPNLVQVVLLSPGAASFELFVNEFDRGDQFKAIVASLA
jgi:UDP-N-acetylmuramoylalanine--D-glutamate ligase